MAKQLLSEDGVDYVLSDKFNQDPLEEHFGRQRAHGGSNENPSLKECMDNERKLVAKSEMIRVMEGNTRGRQEEQTIDINDDRLLPKRKKKGN